MYDGVRTTHRFYRSVVIGDVDGERLDIRRQRVRRAAGRGRNSADECAPCLQTPHSVRTDEPAGAGDDDGASLERLTHTGTPTGEGRGTRARFRATLSKVSSSRRAMISGV